MVARQPANRLHRVASLVGEMQGITAPIGRVGAPFEHAALLELVDQHDQPAGQDVQVVREGLLADPARRVDGSQDARVRR